MLFKIREKNTTLCRVYSILVFTWLELYGRQWVICVYKRILWDQVETKGKRLARVVTAKPCVSTKLCVSLVNSSPRGRLYMRVQCARDVYVCACGVLACLRACICLLCVFSVLFEGISFFSGL
jgi:hypothetical protein